MGDAAQAASGRQGELSSIRGKLKDAEDEAQKLRLLLAPSTLELMSRFGPRTNESMYERVVRIEVERQLAAFGAWYELMPRSQGRAGRHGTFDDVIARLPYVRELGFDVLYFPPIHPIGRTNR